MSLETIFNAKWRWILIISMIFLGIVTFVDMILCGLYYSKIQPWMKGTYLGIQYNALIVTIAFTAISFVTILLIFIFAFFVKQCSGNEKLASSLFTLLHLFTLISFISSILSIYLILKEERLNFSNMYDLDFETSFPFCYTSYMWAMIDVIDTLEKENEIEEYLNWTVKFMDRIFDKKNPLITENVISNYTHYASMDIAINQGDPKKKIQIYLTAIKTYEKYVGLSNYNDKLCKPTANPILAFAILILIGTFFDMIALKINGGCSKNGYNIDNSKDEDQEAN